MTCPVISLCDTCDGADPGLADAVRDAARAEGIELKIQRVSCMSGCANPPALAVRQSGKTAYLFGRFAIKDVPSLMTFLKLYAAHPIGDIADARPLGELRFKVLARIPDTMPPGGDEAAQTNLT